mgnify:CR=1 FL=1
MALCFPGLQYGMGLKLESWYGYSSEIHAEVGFAPVCLSMLALFVLNTAVFCAPIWCEKLWSIRVYPYHRTRCMLHHFRGQCRFCEVQFWLYFTFIPRTINYCQRYNHCFPLILSKLKTIVGANKNITSIICGALSTLWGFIWTPKVYYVIFKFFAVFLVNVKILNMA